jgi:hypothetical protein
MGQTTRHNRHLAERLSPRTITGEGGLPNEDELCKPFQLMRLEEIPRPVPGAGEVLVGVKAAGLGPWDRLARD